MCLSTLRYDDDARVAGLAAIAKLQCLDCDRVPNAQGKDNVFADLPSNLDRSSTTKLLVRRAPPPSPALHSLIGVISCPLRAKQIVLRNALRKRPDSRARLLDEPDCHLNISLKRTQAMRELSRSQHSLTLLIIIDETAEDGSSQEVILGATVEKIVQRITAAQLDSKVRFGGRVTVSRSMHLCVTLSHDTIECFIAREHNLDDLQGLHVAQGAARSAAVAVRLISRESRVSPA